MAGAKNRRSGGLRWVASEKGTSAWGSFLGADLSCNSGVACPGSRQAALVLQTGLIPSRNAFSFPLLDQNPPVATRRHAKQIRTSRSALCVVALGRATCPRFA